VGVVVIVVVAITTFGASPKRRATTKTTSDLDLPLFFCLMLWELNLKLELKVGVSSLAMQSVLLLRLFVCIAAPYSPVSLYCSCFKWAQQCVCA